MMMKMLSTFLNIVGWLLRYEDTSFLMISFRLNRLSTLRSGLEIISLPKLGVILLMTGVLFYSDFVVALEVEERFRFH